MKMLFAQFDMQAAEEFAGAPLISPFGIIVIVIVVFMFRKQIGAYLNTIGQKPSAGLLSPQSTSGLNKPTTEEVYSTLTRAGIGEVEADAIVKEHWSKLRAR